MSHVSSWSVIKWTRFGGQVINSSPEIIDKGTHESLGFLRVPGPFEFFMGKERNEEIELQFLVLVLHLNFIDLIWPQNESPNQLWNYSNILLKIFLLVFSPDKRSKSVTKDGTNQGMTTRTRMNPFRCGWPQSFSESPSDYSTPCTLITRHFQSPWCGTTR